MAYAIIERFFGARQTGCTSYQEMMNNEITDKEETWQILIPT
ncbi:hypothetical protein AOT82_1935 [Psychrobacter sp. AntiMn-1]|nr:hypothetical protein AOT82_1935 [Psychrobacter sp. AntiMn-1]